MPNKTVYYPDRSVPIWDAATRVGKQKGMSLGLVLTVLMERHLPEFAAEPTPEDQWARLGSDTPTARSGNQ